MEFKIENTCVFGLENAVRASGNPMRTTISQNVSNKDFERAEKLSSTPVGEGHDQFLTGCLVQFDLYAPLYMWKQIQRYHFLDFISSQSTMHRLTSFDITSQCVEDTDKIILERYQQLIREYFEFKNRIEPCDMDTTMANADKEKQMWRTLVASLPSGFVLGASMTTNYRQLKTIYHQRNNHKLKEWNEFCKWIENLPHSELIIKQ